MATKKDWHELISQPQRFFGLHKQSARTDVARVGTDKSLIIFIGQRERLLDSHVGSR